ncbi:MAG TPA: sulfite reductase subunit A, partial [Gammaproteobacteria bacterium]|nr:sulfite reductase subunit A [Gammaproteobacteria bacterium]
MADRFLAGDRFNALFEALHAAGYRCMGPRVREGAIVMEEVAEAADLCFGLRDRQAPGSYGLEEGTGRYFAWANGPTALKPLTFAPRETLWRSRQEEDGLRFEAAG